ncbi:hypothetical protein M0804_004194 [Polistes exclamans]|nr:hypothetical protein M0804_004194 [Polistes exclamans]
MWVFQRVEVGDTSGDREKGQGEEEKDDSNGDASAVTARTTPSSSSSSSSSWQIAPPSKSNELTRLTSDIGNCPAPSDCHFPACIRSVESGKRRFLGVQIPVTQLRDGARVDCFGLVWWEVKVVDNSGDGSSQNGALPDVCRNCSTVDGVVTAVNPITWNEIRSRWCKNALAGKKRLAGYSYCGSVCDVNSFVGTSLQHPVTGMVVKMTRRLFQKYQIKYEAVWK